MGCPGSPGLWAAVGFVALLIGSIAAVVIANYTASEEIERDFAWWHRMVIYHVYTPTFFDSDADGVGDLNGRTLFFIGLRVTRAGYIVRVNIVLLTYARIIRMRLVSLTWRTLTQSLPPSLSNVCTHVSDGLYPCIGNVL